MSRNSRRARRLERARARKKLLRRAARRERVLRFSSKYAAPRELVDILHALNPDAVEFMSTLDRTDPIQDRIWQRLDGAEGFPLDLMPDPSVPNCYPTLEGVE